MLNRRQLRIKILHALYAYYQSGNLDLKAGEQWLFKSIAKFYELYIQLLSAFKEIRFIAEEKIEVRKKKILATDEDLSPNLNFIDHPILKNIDINEELISQSDRLKISWTGDHNDKIRSVFRKLKEDDDYLTVMAGADEDSMRAAIIRLFRNYVANDDIIQHYFEEKSILWADDLDLASSMVIKTLKIFNSEENASIPLLDLYKDEEDEIHFIKELFRQTLVQGAENEDLIQNKADNWELDRIALLDMILMKMAIAEAKTFSSIPVKVTLNEYIELSKFYSTPKSSNFINGILDKIFIELKATGKIVKKGRGLIE